MRWAGCSVAAVRCDVVGLARAKTGAAVVGRLEQKLGLPDRVGEPPDVDRPDLPAVPVEVAPRPVPRSNVGVIEFYLLISITMTLAKPKRIVADRPQQLAALTSPARLELLELFGLRGPCAVADVAAHMGRAPDGLYYHVRKLVEVGLVEEVARRRTSHRFERLYRLAADEIYLPRKSKTKSARQTMLKATNAVLRLAGRELGAALDADNAPEQGPQRTVYARRSKAPLTKEALRDLNRHVNAIERIFADAAMRKPRTRRTVAVTIVMSPVPVDERS